MAYLGTDCILFQPFSIILKTKGSPTDHLVGLPVSIIFLIQNKRRQRGIRRSPECLRRGNSQRCKNQHPYFHNPRQICACHKRHTGCPDQIRYDHDTFLSAPFYLCACKRRDHNRRHRISCNLIHDPCICHRIDRISKTVDQRRKYYLQIFPLLENFQEILGENFYVPLMLPITPPLLACITPQKRIFLNFHFRIVPVHFLSTHVQ